MFDGGATVAEVAEAMGRAESTVWGYLDDYIRDHRPKRIDTWVDAAAYERVEAAAEAEHGNRLTSIFERLGGDVSYGQIRAVLAHRRARRNGRDAG